MEGEFIMNRFLLLGLLAIGFSFTSCGGSTSSSGLSGLSLSDIPNTTDAIASATSSGSMTLHNLHALGYPSVHGTPPTMGEVSDAVHSSYTALDTYFWGGTLASFQNPANVNSGNRDDFWVGQNKCYVFQGVGFAAQNIEENSGSLCYMKNAPDAASGVTVTSGGISQASVFDQQSDDRLVRITTTNDGAGGQNVFIRVKGTTNVGSDVYRAELYFCDTSGGGSPNGSESFEFNKTTLVLTGDSKHAEGGGGAFISSITAYLTEGADGSIIFDTSRAREVSMQGHGTWGDFKGYVNISGDRIINKSWNKNSFTDGFGTHNFQNKSYIAADFVGDAENGIRVSSAASKQYFSDGTWDGTNIAGMEFNDLSTPEYATLASGDLYDLASGFVFADDSFFTGSLSTPSTTVDESCAATPDVTVTMDFSDSAVLAIQTLCENHHFENMNFCNGDEVQTAQSNVFQDYGP